MLTMNREAAIKYALELAKTVCSNPENKVLVNCAGADALADFIETLENRFTENSEKAD
jgi:hypothetical protein